MLTKIFTVLLIGAFVYAMIRLVKYVSSFVRFKRAVQTGNGIEFEAPDEDMETSEPPSRSYSPTRSSRSENSYRSKPNLIHLYQCIQSEINKKQRNRSRTRMQRSSRNINHA